MCVCVTGVCASQWSLTYAVEGTGVDHGGVELVVDAIDLVVEPSAADDGQRRTSDCRAGEGDGGG